MKDNAPPPWDKDPLSNYFAQAEFNERACSLRYPDIYDLLRRTDAAFGRLNEAIEKDDQDRLLMPRILVVRTRSSLLAAIRLGMSGQMPEAFALLRSAIENAWYALHIANDPDNTTRSELWLRRNESADAKRRCQQAFTVRQVRETHEAVDPATAKQFHELYEMSIDFGAHPNQLGAMGAMATSEVENRTTFNVGILHPAPLQLLMTMRMAIAVGIGALKVFERIFPERTKLISLDCEVEGLVRQLNVAFRRYQDSPAK